MKKIVIAIVLLLSFFVFQGCAGQVQEPQPTQEVKPIQAEPSQAVVSRQSSAASLASPPSPSTADEKKIIEATGAYQGQADNNFIEIKIDGQPEEAAYMVFMLTGDIKSNFEGMNLKTGDAVWLAYYKNESGQLVLTKFIKNDLQQIDATGIYQGQADNNFIEIKIDGQPEESAYMVFMLTGDIKSNFEGMNLKTGDAVQLAYYKNESGQLVLTNFIKGLKQINATGIYQGQADNNFIEIKIDGQPEEAAYMVFMLTGDIKNNFEKTGLKTGDAVEIEYYKNNLGQLVLTRLEKIQSK